MIEPELALALSVEGNPKTFVPLLGSGISRSAGIPTGWEIILDLIRKVAVLNGADCEPEPEAWFRERYKKEPTYSDLLEAVARTSAERQGLLRGYFEPTPEERDAGKKVPQATHKAIASLVKNGFVRVIVTTNFDRLLEQAIEAEGIVPSVISSVHHLEGAKPFHHTDCTIIKVHGDYLDTTLKNTAKELEDYPLPLVDYLKRVFAEHSLVVCGWSGQWDTALRNTLLSSGTQRYSTYWTHISDPCEEAKAIIQNRNAQLLQIKNSDGFFQSLNNNVLSAQALKRPHPLSVAMAKATLKRLLPEKSRQIELHDFIQQETERVYENMGPKNFPLDKNAPTKEEIPSRAKRYETHTEILRNLFILGARWQEEQHEALWANALQRIAVPPKSNSHYDVLYKMGWYPSFLLTYALGLGSVASKNLKLVARVFSEVTVKNIYEQREPLVLRLHPWDVFSNNVGGHLPEQNERTYTPVSNHVFSAIRGDFRELIPADDDYDFAFQKWEYIFSLAFGDAYAGKPSHPETQIIAGAGRFRWQNMRKLEYGNDKPASYFEAVFGEKEDGFWTREITKHFFENNKSRFELVRNGYENHIKQLRWY